MARNKVEKHIQSGAFHTFKVAAGQNIKIGQVVELTNDREVSVAAPDSTTAVGVVYGGTVGIDGINDGFSGDASPEAHVVTVVVLKPFVYLTAEGAIAAGDKLKVGANGNVVTHTDSGTYVAGEFKQVIGTAITGAAAAGDTIVATTV